MPGSFRAQVEYVELVDLRRHHQQRAGMHLLGDGVVLDQLQHIVAVHHGAFTGAQVLAHLEGVHVHLAGHATVVDQVLGQVGQAIEQALAAGFEEAFDCCRVGQGVGQTMASVIRLMTNWPRLMSWGDRSLLPIQSCSSLRQAR